MLTALTGCSSDGTEVRAESGDDGPTGFEVQYTTPIPGEFFQTASQQGTIELLEYESKDYTSSSRPTTHKPAYVYLPYGYDPTQKYDIIYLLHGWTGVAQEYFLGRGGNSKTSLVNIFDNLIQRGLTRPFIAVSPTWDKDNQSKDWGESTREAAVFSQEYVNDLIPAVETHYSTYLESPNEAGILASRQHRAIGGFSLGSITTWYVFEQAFPYSKWYLPMSGDNWSQGMYGGQYYPEATAQFLADLVNASPYGNDFYVWYACGTEDVRLPQSDNQARAMGALSDTFNASNFSYHMKEGGRHDFNAVYEFCYHALQFFFPANTTEPMTEYYNSQSRISDVINDPAFGNFGRLLFPVDDGYWSGTTLEDLRLTWYNGIDPDKTVEIVNTLKYQAEAGQTIFYDIYTEAEKQADPDKRDTGLFFFKGNSGAPFAICNAGGGFAYVGAMHDSFPHALELSKQREQSQASLDSAESRGESTEGQLSKKGYNAFALIYRPGWTTAYEDLARAITFIYDHADELGVSREGYSLWGGSAGARMAATLGNSANLRQLTGRTDIPQAAAVIMQYTGYDTVSPYDGPTYACCGTSDGIASWRGMQSRLEQLSALGIPTEFHAYNGLPHGFGLGTGTVAEGWIDDAVRFWERLRVGDGTSGMEQSEQTADEQAPMSGTVYLWPEGNIPDRTHPSNSSYDPVDFRPFMEVYTVDEDVTPKGAVLICPGGAFQFRSMQSEGYSVARALRSRGYQCFVVSYRVSPWTMEEGSLDLARAIRYVCSHATDYRIRPEDVATVGFSAGGILCGDEVWHYAKNDGTALDSQYHPDALDLVDARPATVGMIYSFYGRLSVAERNVETLRGANLPPTFYAYGTEDPFYSQFNQQVSCMQQVGYDIEYHVLQGWPHGFGTGGSDNVWVADFDQWLQQIFARTTAVRSVKADSQKRSGIYSLNGTRLSAMQRGVNIVDGKKVAIK